MTVVLIGFVASPVDEARPAELGAPFVVDGCDLLVCLPPETGASGAVEDEISPPIPTIFTELQGE